MFMIKNLVLLWMMAGTSLSIPSLTRSWILDDIIPDENRMVEKGNNMMDSIFTRYNDMSQTMDSKMKGVSSFMDTNFKDLSKVMETNMADMSSMFDQTIGGLDNSWQDVENTWSQATTGLTQFGSGIGDAVNNIPQLDQSDFDFEKYFGSGLTFKYPGWPVMNRFANWWEGENVCKDFEFDEEAKQPDNLHIAVSGNPDYTVQMENCQERWNYRECSKTVVINGESKTVRATYRCCPGYKREIVDGRMSDCIEHQLKPVEETLADLDGSNFLELISETNLLEELRNSTVFMPDNQALEDFNQELKKANTPERPQENIVYNIDDGLLSRRKREIMITEGVEMKEILLGHLSSQVMEVKNFEDNKIIKSKSGNGDIRINVYNTYPHRTYMANCAKLSSKDHHTTDGIVHTLEKVIIPATATLGEVLSTDLQFRTFVSLLDSETLKDLHSEDQTLTVFAPTESAFENLDADVRNALFNKGQCGQSILNSHILPSILCSGIIQGSAKTRTINGEDVRFDRDQDGNLYIEEIMIVMKDMMASNGVIHVIQDVIVPQSAQNLKQALQKKGAYRFLDLIESSGFTDKISENMKTGVTMFLPSEESLSQIPQAVLEHLKGDESKLEEILFHHVVPKKDIGTFRRPENNLKSLSGKTIIPSYEIMAGPTVGCARVLERDYKMCGGNIHTIDRLLTPPKGDVMEILRKSGNHQEFLKLMEFAGLSESPEDPHTIFAPTDAAFTQISDELKEKLFNDQSVAESVVRNHIVPHIVCCSFLQSPFGSRIIRLPSGEQLDMRYSYMGNKLVNGHVITRCDTGAENGVVHELDSILLPYDLRAMEPSFTRRMWLL